MTHIKRINEKLVTNKSVKTLKDILIELSQKCDTNEINYQNVIDALKQELERNTMYSKDPVRIKGDVPYLDESFTRWIATYKYNGKNYKVSYSSDSNLHFTINNKWYYLNGAKRGLQINDLTDDFEDESMRVYVDKRGNVKKLDRTRIEDIDMEATVVYLIKQWVYLQSL